MEMKKMTIEPLTAEKLDQAAGLTADFRVTLKSYKGISASPDIAAGKAELQEYLDAGFPMFCAVERGEPLGYLACRVEEPCVWVESIYVRPERRGKGVGSALFAKAEELAASYGEETVFNYVHPNNHGMIAFLKSRGYNVLNLVEIRRPYAGEQPGGEIQVGEHTFAY